MYTNISRRRFTSVLAALPLVASPVCRAQASCPARPIRLVVLWPPRGGVDVLGRLIQLKLGEFLGQNLIIENFGGGAGRTGTLAVPYQRIAAARRWRFAGGSCALQGRQTAFAGSCRRGDRRWRGDFLGRSAAGARGSAHCPCRQQCRPCPDVSGCADRSTEDCTGSRSKHVDGVCRRARQMPFRCVFIPQQRRH